MQQESLKDLQEYIRVWFNIPEEIPEDIKYDWDYAWSSTYFEKFRFIEYMKNCPDVQNFVYDRAIGIVFINLECGYHSQWMGFLHMLHSKMTSKEVYEFTDGLRDLSDNFLGKKRGFYMSSIRDNIYKASVFKLNAQEKIVFKNYPTKDIM